MRLDGGKDPEHLSRDLIGGIKPDIVWYPRGLIVSLNELASNGVIDIKLKMATIVKSYLSALSVLLVQSSHACSRVKSDC